MQSYPVEPGHAVVSSQPGSSGFGGIVDWAKDHKVATSVIGVVAFFVLVGVIGSTAETSNTTAQVADTGGSNAGRADEPATAPEASDEVPPEPAIELPDDEAKFISIVENASNSIAADANELQVVQVKTKRGEDMCALLGPSLAVNDWVGTVEDVSTELGGDKGVFAVSISDNVAVQTWNNSMSDFDSNTLIDPSSPLFNTISTFSPGDIVKFSGKFISGDKCLSEQSMVDISGLRTPDFTFKFSTVEKR